MIVWYHAMPFAASIRSASIWNLKILWVELWDPGTVFTPPQQPVSATNYHHACGGSAQIRWSSNSWWECKGGSTIVRRCGTWWLTFWKIANLVAISLIFHRLLAWLCARNHRVSHTTRNRPSSTRRDIELHHGHSTEYFWCVLTLSLYVQTLIAHGSNN